MGLLEYLSFARTRRPEIIVTHPHPLLDNPKEMDKFATRVYERATAEMHRRRGPSSIWDSTDWVMQRTGGQPITASTPDVCTFVNHEIAATMLQQELFQESPTPVIGIERWKSLAYQGTRPLRIDLRNPLLTLLAVETPDLYYVINFVGQVDINPDKRKQMPLCLVIPVRKNPDKTIDKADFVAGLKRYGIPKNDYDLYLNARRYSNR